MIYFIFISYLVLHLFSRCSLFMFYSFVHSGFPRFFLNILSPLVPCPFSTCSPFVLRLFSVYSSFVFNLFSVCFSHLPYVFVFHLSSFILRPFLHFFLICSLFVFFFIYSPFIFPFILHFIPIYFSVRSSLFFREVKYGSCAVKAQ